MNDQGLNARRELLCNFLTLADRPSQSLKWLIFGFFSFELLLVILHIAARSVLQGVAGGTSDGHVGAFDLADEATLAVWFSSFQLTLLSLAAVGLSWADRSGPEPESRTALWKIAALLFFVMAIDETAGLHEVFGKGMALVFSGLPLSARHWGMLPYALTVTAVIGGAAARFRKRPTYLAGVLAAWLLWVLGQAADQLSPFDPNVNIVLEEGLEMAGTTVLLATLAQFLVNKCSRNPNKFS
jgi:hypothetical protein